MNKYDPSVIRAKSLKAMIDQIEERASSDMIGHVDILHLEAMEKAVTAFAVSNIKEYLWLDTAESTPEPGKLVMVKRDGKAINALFFIVHDDDGIHWETLDEQFQANNEKRSAAIRLNFAEQWAPIDF